MRSESVPLSHFENLYRRGADPWRFATSAYEAAKYAATLDALPRRRYGKALEVGCSIGVFTAGLAGRCDDLLAIEPVATALAAARERNRDSPTVRFAEAAIPDGWPAEPFDLVVLSEILDYLSGPDLRRVGDALRSWLGAGGDVVMVHWLGKKRSAEPQHDEASEVLIAATAGFLTPLLQHRNADYRLDVLRRSDSPE